jgi:hypothetical protein
MIWWFGTPLGRIIQGIVGIVLLWIGVEEATALGLLVMMTGLVAAVVAAAPPAFLMAVPAIRGERRPRVGA